MKPSAAQSPSASRFTAEGLHRWLSAFPYAGIALFYSLGLHARLRLGHWPSFGDNSLLSYDLFFFLHRAVVVAAVILLFGSPILWLSLMPAADAGMSVRSYLAKLVVFLTGLGSAILLATYDPGGLVNWFFD